MNNSKINTNMEQCQGWSPTNPFSPFFPPTLTRRGFESKNCSVNPQSLEHSTLLDHTTTSIKVINVIMLKISLSEGFFFFGWILEKETELHIYTSGNLS